MVMLMTTTFHNIIKILLVFDVIAGLGTHIIIHYKYNQIIDAQKKFRVKHQNEESNS